MRDKNIDLTNKFRSASKKPIVIIHREICLNFGATLYFSSLRGPGSDLIKGLVSSGEGWDSDSPFVALSPYSTPVSTVEFGAVSCHLSISE